MRTLGFRTHVLLTLLGCGGVVAALGLPWSAASGAEPGSGDSLDQALASLGRWAGAADGVPGHTALGSWAPVLTGLAGFTALMAAFCLAAALRGLAREGLRLGAPAIVAIVAWKLVDHPGDELRQGALIAAGASLVLVASALAVAATPVRRARAQRFGHPGVFVPPPAPPRWEEGGSVPPPS